MGIFALVRTGSSATYFTPETTPSSIYSHVYSVTNNKASVEPAPIFEEDISSQETKGNFGNQNSFKSHNNIYSALENFQAHVSDLTHPTAYDQTVSALSDYRPRTFSSPLIGSRISIPVTYTTHTQSKPFQTHTSQLITKTSGSTHNYRTPIEQNEAIKTTITYAQAPEVSHTTFTGHGTTYSW